jgi:hypothetical protein
MFLAGVGDRAFEVRTGQELVEVPFCAKVRVEAAASSVRVEIVFIFVIVLLRIWVFQMQNG